MITVKKESINVIGKRKLNSVVVGSQIEWLLYASMITVKRKLLTSYDKFCSRGTCRLASVHIHDNCKKGINKRHRINSVVGSQIEWLLYASMITVKKEAIDVI